ncbi:MAG TPA: ABC transporter permease [Blastocatellia bacterium]
MKHSQSSFSDTVFSLLLKTYPSEFRVEYGAEMSKVFRDRYREHKHRPARLFTLWLATAVDCAATAPREHMDLLAKDIRYAFRAMRQSPVFTTVAVLTLTLGIGATTAIFSIASAVILKPLPYPRPDRLVWISGTNPSGGIADEGASGPDYLDWRSQNECFEDIGCYAGWRPAFTSDSEPERLSGCLVSSNIFDVLGRGAMLGRTFTSEEEQEGKNQVVVLAYSLWQRRFGGDPKVIGRGISLNGGAYSIVGVMPRDFGFPRTRATEIWAPIVALAKAPRRADFLGVVGRLKPGVSVSQARAEMNRVTEQLERQYPASNTGWKAKVVSLSERAVRGIKPAIVVLLIAVAFLLAIACANVSNLLLVRATSRQKEIAVRMALGAGRWRLIRQLLTESLLLALLGGAGGVLLAFFAVRGLIAISPPDTPRIGQAGIDSTVLVFTVIVSLLTGVCFGLAPALHSSNADLGESLKEGGRGSAAGEAGNRLRAGLTIAEVSLAMVLLISAGLMIKSFVRLESINPGFDSTGLLTIQLSLPETKYAQGPSLSAFYAQLLDTASGLPGVRSSALSDALPIADGGNYLAFIVEGRPPVPPGVNQDSEFTTVSPGYFQTMGIRLIKGRGFASSDGTTTPPVAVINDVFARKYFPEEDPLGKRVSFGAPTPLEIVGIVTATRTESLDAEPYSQAYASYLQNPARHMSLLLRGSGDLFSLLPAVRGAVASIDRDQPLNDVQTMDGILAHSVDRQRLSMVLLAVFSVVALTLSGVGIYGVMAYTVKHRTHEIGVRMALGARSNAIRLMVVRQGMALAGIGVIAGLVAAFALTRFMSNLLFGVSTADIEIFALIPPLIGLVAFLACYLPARKATGVDPMIALRCE